MLKWDDLKPFHFYEAKYRGTGNVYLFEMQGNNLAHISFKNGKPSEGSWRLTNATTIREITKYHYQSGIEHPTNSKLRHVLDNDY